MPSRAGSEATIKFLRDVKRFPVTMGQQTNNYCKLQLMIIHLLPTEINYSPLFASLSFL